MSAPPQFLTELSTRQYLSMAGQTILTYDYFLTLGLEVDYIWNAPWNAVKVIFLLNRYGTLIVKSILSLEELGLLSHGSRKFCVTFQWFQSILVLISIETSRILLLLRARALWKCSYRVAISLVSVYVIYVLTLSGYASYVIFTYSAYFVIPYLDETGVCVILVGSTSTVWLLSFASFALDTAVFAMIAYYLYQLCKESQELHHSPLVRLLVRDAFLFYTANLLYDVLGIVGLSVLTNDPRYYVMVALAFPLLTVTGQRVVLNLRGLQSHSYAMQNISRDVDRQIAAMQHRSFWKSVDVWMNDPHLELGLDEEPTQRKTTRARESQVIEEDGSYELDVIRTEIRSKHTDSGAHHAPYDSFVDEH